MLRECQAGNATPRRKGPTRQTCAPFKHTENSAAQNTDLQQLLHMTIQPRSIVEPTAKQFPCPTWTARFRNQGLPRPGRSSPANCPTRKLQSETAQCRRSWGDRGLDMKRSCSKRWHRSKLATPLPTRSKPDAEPMPIGSASALHRVCTGVGWEGVGKRQLGLTATTSVARTAPRPARSVSAQLAAGEGSTFMMLHRALLVLTLHESVWEDRP